MSSKIKEFLLLLIITILPTLLIWLPFYMRTGEVLGVPLAEDGMATIVANYDGPLYIVVAKTLYESEMIQEFTFDLPSVYYTAHFPLYPLIIRLFSLVFSYPYAMLAATVITSITAVYFFKKLISDFVDEQHVWWITFVFAVFPARWLIVRSVGSPEPLFLTGIIASIYYFRKRKFLWAGLWGIVAQLTKSPGILLFIAYALTIFFPAFKRGVIGSFNKMAAQRAIIEKIPLLLIPISLVVLFYFYFLQMGDFFAYFNSGDNIHLFFPPFQIFDYSQPWVGTFWLEEVIFIYLFGILALQRLFKLKEEVIFWFFATFFTSIIFVSHRDIIRYSLPLVPFMLAAYSDLITKKEFRYAILFILVPIYLFSLAYITNNVTPISDWSPLL